MSDYLEEEGQPINLHPPMKIIIWNCQGAGKLAFPVHCLGLKHSYHPYIMVIMETKVSDRRAQRIIHSLGFPDHFIVIFEGIARGIWVL